jgi:hypothetical protein
VRSCDQFLPREITGVNNTNPTFVSIVRYLEVGMVPFGFNLISGRRHVLCDVRSSLHFTSQQGMEEGGRRIKVEVVEGDAGNARRFLVYCPPACATISAFKRLLRLKLSLSPGQDIILCVDDFEIFHDETIDVIGMSDIVRVKVLAAVPSAPPKAFGGKKTIKVSKYPVMSAVPSKHLSASTGKSSIYPVKKRTREESAQLELGEPRKTNQNTVAKMKEMPHIKKKERDARS